MRIISTYTKGGMRVQELVDMLNKQIQKVDLTKVHDHSEFHKTIKNNITSLPNGLTLDIWGIYSNINSRDIIIRYTRDFQEYKNCKYGSKGKFSNVRFIIEPTIPNLPIEEVNDFFKQKRRLTEINDWKKFIEIHKKEIQEAENRLKELNA